MISQNEIFLISKETGILPDVIDRDWVQTYILASIYTTPKLKDILIFKGAGALRKCWYANYRLTEDLDFSSISDSFELNSDHLDSVCSELEKNVGIYSYYESISPMLYNGKTVGYDTKIYFWGANHQKKLTKISHKLQSYIKIEISIDECKVGKPVVKSILHPYSDKDLLNDICVLSLDLSELFAEKLRTVITRPFTSPKDYFDLWHLINNSKDCSKSLLKEIFMEKMGCKKNRYEGVKQILNDDKELKLSNAWNATLIKLLSRDKVPTIDDVKHDLNNFFFNF